MKKNRKAITAKFAPARTLCKVLAAGVLCFPLLVSTALADVTIGISSKSGSTIIDISVSNGVRATRQGGPPPPPPPGYKPQLRLSSSINLPPRCLKFFRDNAFVDDFACLATINYYPGVNLSQGSDKSAAVAVAACRMPDLQRKLFTTPLDFLETREVRRRPPGNHSETKTDESQAVSHYFTAGETKEKANDYGYLELTAVSERTTPGPGRPGPMYDVAALLALAVPQQFSEESGVLKNFQLKYAIAGMDPADFGFVEGTHTAQSGDCGKVTVSVQGPTVVVLAPRSEMKVNEKHWSENGQFYAIFQTDGNLKVATKDDGYKYDMATWQKVPLFAEKLIMQADGNLMFYGPNDTYIWGMDKILRTVANSTLNLSNSGNFFLLAPDGKVLWTSIK